MVSLRCKTYLRSKFLYKLTRWFLYTETNDHVRYSHARTAERRRMARLNFDFAHMSENRVRELSLNAVAFDRKQSGSKKRPSPDWSLDEE